MTAMMLLFLSFMIQPFHQALANEVAADAAEENILPAQVEEQLPDVVDVPTEDDQATAENGSADSEVSVQEAPSEVATSDAASDSTESVQDDVDTTQLLPADDSTDSGEAASGGYEIEIVPTEGESTNGATDELVDDTSASSSTDGDDAPATSNDDTTANVDAEVPGDVTNEGSAEPTTDTDMVSDEPDAVGTSSGDDDLIDNVAIEADVNDLVDSVVNEVVTLTRQMVTEENYYQFSKQSCVAVGDGTYHCTTKDRANIDPGSAVFAEQDATGDKEIYMRTSKGEVKQLTDNEFDDSSPDMDLASMRVVWQRMIDGRYQIISYNLETQEETQLTFSRTNNMEPKAAKEGIVWQAWDGADWEIIYFDGQFTDQLTDNDIQDVTPVIEDGYVLWSILGGENSEARVYSIESGELMTITGHEGGAVANPRFVLVYDTKFDNGDVVTLGFDPVTGLAQPVSAKPAELPFDIPEPDPVGEIRALIQNKSTQKEKEVVTVPVDGGPGDLNLAAPSTSSPDTLILSQQLDHESAAILAATSAVPDLILDEYDLVITKEASSTTSVINRNYLAATSSVIQAASTQP